MGRVLNLMAFVVFATSLFMRSVDPVIPQIAAGLNVEPTSRCWARSPTCSARRG
jgi:hypothetical protein